MKQEFGHRAPLVRLAFAVAALSITVSIGSFIDFLATDYVAVVADMLYGSVRVAQQTP